MSSEVAAMSSKMNVPAAPVTVAITITASTDRVTPAATAAHPYALAVTPPPATPSTIAIAVPAISPAVAPMMPTPTSAPVSSTVAHSHAPAAPAASHAAAMAAVLHRHHETLLVGLRGSLRPT